MVKFPLAERWLRAPIIIIIGNHLSSHALEQLGSLSESRCQTLDYTLGYICYLPMGDQPRSCITKGLRSTRQNGSALAACHSSWTAQEQWGHQPRQR